MSAFIAINLKRDCMGGQRKAVNVCVFASEWLSCVRGVTHKFAILGQSKKEESPSDSIRWAVKQSLPGKTIHKYTVMSILIHVHQHIIGFISMISIICCNALCVMCKPPLPCLSMEKDHYRTTTETPSFSGSFSAHKSLRHEALIWMYQVQQHLLVTLICIRNPFICHIH